MSAAEPLPEGEIVLDRDGQFWFGGAPCIRREITDLFFEHLEADGGGGYRIRLGPQTAPVRVEGAPLRVQNLLPTAGGATTLVLDGGLTETLDPATLRFEADVPWCRARGMDARFTPTAALALTDLVQHDEEGAYLLGAAGKRIRV